MKDERNESDKRNVVDIGTCCICGGGDGFTSGLLPLDYEAPVFGTGWGCTVCGLPPNGLMVVVCQACLDHQAAGSEDGIASFDTSDFRQAVYGSVIDRRRFDMALYPLVPFGHRLEAHKTEEALLMRLRLVYEAQNKPRQPKRQSSTFRHRRKRSNHD